MVWRRRIKEAREDKIPQVLFGHRSLSQYFGVSEGTISKWISTGFLPAMKDPSGIWFTSIDLITQWILAGSACELEAEYQKHKPYIDEYRRGQARLRAAGKL